MYKYKLEKVAQPISIYDKMTDTARVVLEYVIYDGHGQLHAICPRGWSEQQVVQEVDRLNADQRTTQDLGGPAHEADTEGNHD